jgi:hypothetical protein
MKAVQQVLGKTVEFGRKPSGWLPSNAATPLPTRLVLDVRILDLDGEFILEWESRNGDYRNDTWHQNLEEAKNEAKEQFGIEASEWREID